jgi:hypothetical protein
MEGMVAAFDRHHRVRHGDVQDAVVANLYEWRTADVLLEQLIPFDDDVGLRCSRIAMSFGARREAARGRQCDGRSPHTNMPDHWMTPVVC